MPEDPIADTPDPAHLAALRAVAENPAVRPSLRVAARKALRKMRQPIPVRTRTAGRKSRTD